MVKPDQNGGRAEGVEAPMQKLKPVRKARVRETKRVVPEPEAEQPAQDEEVVGHEEIVEDGEGELGNCVDFSVPHDVGMKVDETLLRDTCRAHRISPLSIAENKGGGYRLKLRNRWEMQQALSLHGTPVASLELRDEKVHFSVKEVWAQKGCRSEGKVSVRLPLPSERIVLLSKMPPHTETDEVAAAMKARFGKVVFLYRPAGEFSRWCAVGFAEEKSAAKAKSAELLLLRDKRLSVEAWTDGQATGGGEGVLVGSARKYLKALSALNAFVVPTPAMFAAASETAAAPKEKLRKGHRKRKKREKKRAEREAADAAAAADSLTGAAKRKASSGKAEGAAAPPSAKRAKAAPVTRENRSASKKASSGKVKGAEVPTRRKEKRKAS